MNNKITLNNIHVPSSMDKQTMLFICYFTAIMIQRLCMQLQASELEHHVI